MGITIGVTVGMLAGWYGGWVDEVCMRLVDIKLAIPTILLALVMVLALGQSFVLIVAVLALTIWPRIARNVRGEVLSQADSQQLIRTSEPLSEYGRVWSFDLIEAGCHTAPCLCWAEARTTYRLDPTSALHPKPAANVVQS